MGVEIQHHIHYAHFDQSGVRKVFTVNYVWGQHGAQCAYLVTNCPDDCVLLLT